MQLPNQIKLKLERRKLSALGQAYSDAIASRQVMRGNHHDELLAEAAIEMRIRIAEALLRPPYPARVSIRFSRLEALAFFQYWIDQPIYSPEAGLVINELIAAIDQQRRIPRILITASL